MAIEIQTDTELMIACDLFQHRVQCVGIPLASINLVDNANENQDFNFTDEEMLARNNFQS